jgi:hypothetical protein
MVSQRHSQCGHRRARGGTAAAATLLPSCTTVDAVVMSDALIRVASIQVGTLQQRIDSRRTRYPAPQGGLQHERDGARRTTGLYNVIWSVLGPKYKIDFG